MKNVLIVDDEQIVRIAMRSLIDWNSSGFNMFEASNGKIALDKIREGGIDILMTDLNMPLMNGFELLKEISKQNISIPSIILSVFDDYDSVRTAFRYGAVDYIVKTRMDEKSVLAALSEASSHIKPNKNTKTTTMKEQQRELVISIISGEKVPTSNHFESLGLLSEAYIAVCVTIDSLKEFSRKNALKYGANLTRGIEKVVSEMDSSCLLIPFEQGEYIIIHFLKQKDKTVVRNLIGAFYGGLRTTLQTYFNLGITCGVSQITDDIEQLEQICMDARENAKQKLFLGKNRNIYPEDAVLASGEKGDISESISAFLRLPMDNYDSVSTSLEQIFSLIMASFPSTLEGGIPYYIELTYLLTPFIEARHADYEHDFLKHLMQIETYEEINNYVRNLVAWITDGSYKNTYSSHIYSAIKFLKKNCSQEISLNRISEYVGLSEGYFSSLFTKETGVSFVDFLTSVRIDRAKVLLKSSNAKMYEIAEQVGFLSYEHFCRVFKKVTGQTPGQYKGV